MKFLTLPGFFLLFVAGTMTAVDAATEAEQACGFRGKIGSPCKIKLDANGHHFIPGTCQEKCSSSSKRYLFPRHELDIHWRWCRGWNVCNKLSSRVISTAESSGVWCWGVKILFDATGSYVDGFDFWCAVGPDVRPDLEDDRLYKRYTAAQDSKKILWLNAFEKKSQVMDKKMSRL
ncbi:hypothetical protein GG344DRAFT_64746 [Lentinula edodes]|nr:hypothetical protein GG344DRAFT_64746 [Lentinula edodes]